MTIVRHHSCFCIPSSCNCKLWREICNIKLTSFFNISITSCNNRLMRQRHMIRNLVFQTNKIHNRIPNCCVFWFFPGTYSKMSRFRFFIFDSKTITNHEHTVPLLRNAIVCSTDNFAPYVIIANLPKLLFYFFYKKTFIKICKTFDVLHKEEFRL